MKENKYRIRVRLGGFEPQMQYESGADGKKFWTPLRITGYWAEPDSFMLGSVKGKYPLPLRDARIAIERARRINQGSLIAVASGR